MGRNIRSGKELIYFIRITVFIRRFYSNPFATGCSALREKCGVVRPQGTMAANKPQRVCGLFAGGLGYWRKGKVQYH